MARQNLSQADQDATHEPIAQQAGTSSDPTTFSLPRSSYLARMADLVAAGEAEFPAQLSEDEVEQLRRLVQQRLRDRLIRYIAQQIAVDLHNRSNNTE